MVKTIAERHKEFQIKQRPIKIKKGKLVGILKKEKIRY